MPCVWTTKPSPVFLLAIWEFKYQLCEGMPGDGLSSLARGEGNQMQHEELQDWTRDVVQHKEQAVKVPKVTDTATRDGWVSWGGEGRSMRNS